MNLSQEYHDSSERGTLQMLPAIEYDIFFGTSRLRSNKWKYHLKKSWHVVFSYQHIHVLIWRIAYGQTPFVVTMCNILYYTVAVVWKSIGNAGLGVVGTEGVYWSFTRVCVSVHERSQVVTSITRPARQRRSSGRSKVGAAVK